LAFLGKPAEALEYFQVDRLGDVYDRLAQQGAEYWQAAFRQSSLWQSYVVDRLPSEPERNVLPATTAPIAASRLAHQFIRQTSLLAWRYAAIWQGDSLSLLAMASQALIVALLLGILFGDLGRLSELDRAQRSLTLLFLLAVSSFWFGCNNAAKEIVKERNIYTRERDYNLLIGSYYSSKLLVLTACTWVQTTMLFTIVRLWCATPGGFISELVVLLAVALAGVTLGLAISALAATEEVAITLVPIVVIPQIILAGVIAPLEGLSKALAMSGISTYWAKRALDACLPSDLAKVIALEQHSAGVAVMVLLAHAMVGAATALAWLQYQSVRKR
jgi:ABC-type multidrug transport system permease subunit